MACLCKPRRSWRGTVCPLRSIARTALALALTICAGCQTHTEPAPLRGADVVLIVVDTLRADHLGFSGYPRPTSPFLDKLAAESAVFTNTVAPSSFTRESVAALFTGRWPSCIGAVGWNATPKDSSTTLAEDFANAGYRTVMLTLTTMLSDPAFARGFHHVEHLARQWGVSRAGPQLTRRALELWQEPRAQPLFLYLHYLDPHGPYDPPAEVLARFGAFAPEADALDLYRDIRPHLPELRRSGFGIGDPRFHELVRRYDAEIAHTDLALKELFGGLHARDTGRRLLVVLTADHGEEFLEHGFVEHAWTLYQESVRVPLLLWAPGVIRPEHSPQPASLVDVAPTLRQLVGLRGSADDGEVLFAPAKVGLGARPLGERLRFSELGIAERNVVRALWRGEWKYIAARRWLAPEARAQSSQIEERLRQSGTLPSLPTGDRLEHEELFHLASDPAEQRDRKHEAPEELACMRQLVEAHERRCPFAGPASHPAATLAPHEAEALRQLGY